MQRRYNDEHGITPQTIQQGDRRRRWSRSCEADYVDGARADAAERPTTLARRRTSCRGDARRAAASEMREAAKALDFERAAELRDRIHALETPSTAVAARAEPCLNAGAWRRASPALDARTTTSPSVRRSRCASTHHATPTDDTRRSKTQLARCRPARRLPAEGRARQGDLRRQGAEPARRVRSYFRGGDERCQVPFLVERVGDARDAGHARTRRKR